jgi:hypothetical protein
MRCLAEIKVKNARVDSEMAKMVAAVERFSAENR